MSELCPHGMAEWCPDCPPRGIEVGGGVVGPRRALAKGRVVQRWKEDGSLDWFTSHLTKRGARRAAERYERTGEVRGFRP